MHVVQLTSAHPRHDVRIFHKQCRSLAEAGLEVTLVVADGKGDDLANGVMIRDVGRSAGRARRMLGSASRVFRTARRLKADLYHLHDPELIPWGLALRGKGAPVVFDAHEDLPAQIASKYYLSKWVRGPLARTTAVGEAWAFHRFDALVGATPAITQQLLQRNNRSALVANYPLRNEFAPPHDRQPQHALFAGAISRIRGIGELADAMALTKPGRRLHLVGPMAHDGIAARVEASAGRPAIDVLGTVDRQRVADEMATAVCGVVTFLDAPNHVDAQPNKLFEYMSAGIPVIASHFELWRSLIEGERCGLCVDPADSRAIAEAIDFLFDNPAEAEEMGRRGRAAIELRLNWETQAEALLELYRSLGVRP
jgi:glycosyltransferase involved in cell wall biosynthesis